VAASHRAWASTRALSTPASAAWRMPKGASGLVSYRDARIALTRSALRCSSSKTMSL